MSDTFFLALFFAIPVFIINVAVCSTKKNNQRALEKAIARGHVVTAVLKKRSAPVFDYTSNHDGGTYYRVTYEYEYKGRKYTFKAWMHDPAYTETLYFVDNPRKAALKGALNEMNYKGIMIYGIIAAILCLLGF